MYAEYKKAGEMMAGLVFLGKAISKTCFLPLSGFVCGGR